VRRRHRLLTTPQIPSPSRPRDCPDNRLPGTACDWWVAEYRPETREAFGYVSLGMPGCAEWGYIALDELELLNHRGMVVERDLLWTPTRACDAKLPR
jgi:hypothetical protein